MRHLNILGQSRLSLGCPCECQHVLGGGDQVAAIRKEAAKWQELEESKHFLEAQVAQVRSREQQEAARANDFAAQVARLQSQLAAAKLDVQTAREQAALAAIEAPVSCLKTPLYGLIVGMLKRQCMVHFGSSGRRAKVMCLCHVSPRGRWWRLARWQSWRLRRLRRKLLCWQRWTCCGGRRLLPKSRPDDWRHRQGSLRTRFLIYEHIAFNQLSLTVSS